MKATLYPDFGPLARGLRRISGILALAALSGLPQSALGVTLAWDPNSEPDLAGYILYYGNASRSYSYSTNVGNVTNFTVSGLASGIPWYFAVVAVNTAGLESDYSNEVTNTVVAAATNAVPIATVTASQTVNQDGMQLRVTGPPNSRYQIQFSIDLVNWGLLTDVSLTANGDFELSLPWVAGLPRCFYRAVPSP